MGQGQDKKRRIYRGALYHALSPSEWAYFPEGALVIAPSGKIEVCGSWAQISKDFENQDYDITALPPGHMILPGFVDTHLHLPQLEATGRQENSLLTWLDKHIFPAEKRFEEADHARRVSRWFFQELLRNGTTTANVFLTLHTAATEIAFETAQETGNRVVMGLNLMDRNAPKYLLRPAGELLADTEALCRQWHGHEEGRLQYAWVPRFAITSTEELLGGIGKLRQKYPDVMLHTHLSEQRDEVDKTLALFPGVKHYTDVYDSHGLLGEKTLLAHSIHLSDTELGLLHDRRCSLAHCPSANFFLKSGRFRWFDVHQQGLTVGLGSDVGAGPEMSMFKVMKDAQYTQEAQAIDCHELFYASTLGGAAALGLGSVTGNFETGKDADFLILDFAGKPNLPQVSTANDGDIQALLSMLIYLGDDRLVSRTFVRGREVSCRSDLLALRV